jgi:glycosidase
MDSKLLSEDPAYFVNVPADGRSQPRGTFPYRDGAGRDLWVFHGGYDAWGGVDFWIDTAQYDYSNPALRRRMVGIVERWAGDFGVDGFRVDMAYLELNGLFGRTWQKQMPRREFLEELTTEVKARHPGTAFIAEGYDGWDDLSRVGFDLIYSKNDMQRPGGHWGWYDSLQSRDPGRIRAALRRAAYLAWQKGGADGTAFVGNHDEAAPRRAFGPWTEGATFLTLLRPGSLLFYGSQEIGFDRPDPREPKSIPFGVPVSVDWQNPDARLKAFHDDAFRQAREVHAALGESDLQVLPSGGEPPWVGYLLVPREPAGLRAAAVLANPTDREVEVFFEEPRLGVRWSGRLPPWGYRLVRF